MTTIDPDLIERINEDRLPSTLTEIFNTAADLMEQDEHLTEAEAVRMVNPPTLDGFIEHVRKLCGKPGCLCHHCQTRREAEAFRDGTGGR